MAEHRRRGTELEDAIYEAAWAELKKRGYNAMSMSKIAEKAGTSKAVLYRRWVNKDELVISALCKFAHSDLDKKLPNNGSLRDDVLDFLTNMSEHLYFVGPQVLLMFMSADLGSDESNLTDRLPFIKFGGNVASQTVAALVRQAAERGEITNPSIPYEITALPLNLLRFKVLAESESTESVESAILKIVDNIFLPLVKNYQ